jgi:3-hydroxyacyl-CoA dehydrogenase
VIIERPGPKQALMARIEKDCCAQRHHQHQHLWHPDPHHQQRGARESFKQRFLGTHFFNPPRYLHLLEIIPTPDTDPAIVSA